MRARLACLRLENLAHSPLTDRVDDAIRTQVELGAAVEQLFYLPSVQQSPLDNLIGNLPVGRWKVRIGLIPFRPAHPRPGFVELHCVNRPLAKALFEGRSVQIAHRRYTFNFHQPDASRHYFKAAWISPRTKF